MTTITFLLLVVAFLPRYYYCYGSLQSQSGTLLCNIYIAAILYIIFWVRVILMYRASPTEKLIAQNLLHIESHALMAIGGTCLVDMSITAAI